MDLLDGMFSFVLLNTHDKSFIAARDAIGITPLYIGWGLDGMNFLLSFLFNSCYVSHVWPSNAVLYGNGIFFGT